MNFLDLDIKLQAALISASTTIAVLVMGWIFKILYDKHSLTYKLRKEYDFDQKKKLKEEMAKTKILLLNAAEEFNYRMWNFNKNIGNNFHKIKEHSWFETKQYYLNSFIYRFLLLMHYCIKAEEGTFSIDSTVADKKDFLYLKYIKSLKNIFCEISILEELDYTIEDEDNHFFRNELKAHVSTLLLNQEPMEFEPFCLKLKSGYPEMKKVIEYFSTISNCNSDKSLNVLRCAHILTIHFLNDFGHTYQHTEKNKMKSIALSYRHKIMIKSGFKNFIIQSKLINEMKYFNKELGIK